MFSRRLFTLCAVASLVGACSNNSSSTENVDSLGSLQLSGASALATYACASYTVALLDANKAPKSASADVTVTLSGLGNGHAYANAVDCQTGSATTTLTLAKGQTSVSFYYRTSEGEALTLSATAKGAADGTLSVTATLMNVLGQSYANGVDQTAETFGSSNLGVFLAGSKTLVTDPTRNRVLIWNGTPAPHSWADVALGQPNPGTGLLFTVNANTLAAPQSAWSDGTRIAVADTSNCRVLVWNTWPTKSGQPADFALGQAGDANNLTSNVCNVASASSLSRPSGVWSDGSRLFVADSNNFRVLVWNAWPTAGGQAADLVLGQNDMNSRIASNANAMNVSVPISIYTHGTQLFVADDAFHRVMVWNTLPTQNGQAADFALGQPDDATNLTSSASQTTAGGLYRPMSVTGDGTHLLVADQYNNRVLVWNQVPSAPTNADFALGQTPDGANLTSSLINTTAGGLHFPTGVASNGNYVLVADSSNARLLIWDSFPSATQLDASVAVGVAANANNLNSVGGFQASDGVHTSAYGVAIVGQQLFVADTLHMRVLVWNTLPTSPTQPADFALGQAAGPNNLTDKVANANGPVSASGMYDPAAVASDGVHLFVSDLGNNRVLIWNHLPTAPVPADVVLGKPSMDANTSAAVDGNSMSEPFFLATDGQKLYVADYGDNRVLGWNSIPTQNGQYADFVLGQAAGPTNLTSRAVNDGNSTPSAASMRGPYGVSIINGKLYVADTGNRRVLVYNTLPSSGGASADFVLGASDLNTAGTSVVSASTMANPISIVGTSSHLYVTDYTNLRVLVWNTFPTASGTPADAAIGQTDPNAFVPSPYPQANKFALPVGLATDGTRLFVCDFSNQRLLIVPTVP